MSHIYHIFYVNADSTVLTVGLISADKIITMIIKYKFLNTTLQPSRLSMRSFIAYH